MTEPKKYYIKTVEDLLLVPRDKWEDCLSNMVSYLETLLTFDVAELQAAGELRGFVFVDDGEVGPSGFVDIGPDVESGEIKSPVASRA